MPRSSQSIIDHADELAARFESAEPNPLAPPEQATVTQLRAAVVERGRAEAEVLAAITRARAAGVSWTVLATVLGTSRQNAQKLYSRG